MFIPALLEKRGREGWIGALCRHGDGEVFSAVSTPRDSAREDFFVLRFFSSSVFSSGLDLLAFSSWQTHVAVFLSEARSSS